MDASAPNTVWQTTVSGLTRDTTYYFEAYIMNLCCTALTRPGPELAFYANDVLVGTGTTEIPGMWMGVSTMWNSGGFDTVTLALRNRSTVFSGNDFAADDIYLGLESQVAPEPASLVLLGTGLLMAAARRRSALRCYLPIPVPCKRLS